MSGILESTLALWPYAFPQEKEFYISVLISSFREIINVCVFPSYHYLCGPPNCKARKGVP